MPNRISIDPETLLGKGIAEICPQGFHDSEANHCAHFVAHVGGYRFGYQCHKLADSAHSTSNPGVCVRVQEILPHCPEVGRWENLPATEDDLLVFITARSNVDIASKTMANVPKKHIGIFSKGSVYHYSNGDDVVVKQTPNAVLKRFRKAYADETVELFYGTLPSTVGTHALNEDEAPELAPDEALRLEVLAHRERIDDLLDSLGAVGAPSAAAPQATVSILSVKPKLAIVVGHTAKAPGATGIGGVAPHEYSWNSDLAEKVVKAAGSGIECKVFLRDGVGIAGAYKNVVAWGATASIELHYNADGGAARGTETIYGTSFSGSERWATAVQKSLVSLYDRKGKQDRGIKKAPPHPRGRENVNALDKIPSCLIEPFFGDNAEDAALGAAKKADLAKALVSVFRKEFAPGGGPGILSLQALSSYEPPTTAAKFIAEIDLRPEEDFEVGEIVKGLTELRKLAGGVVFLDTDLSTDADGSPRAKQIDPDGQLETAYNFAGQTGQARYVNAEAVPYVVMPGSNQPSPRPKEEYLYRRLGLQMGDLAVVIWKDRIECAMLADAGANDMIGEGAIALVESLGWNPWNAGKKKIVSGIPGPGVLTFLFPGSKIAGLKPANAAAKIRESARALFEKIGGKFPSA